MYTHVELEGFAFSHDTIDGSLLLRRQALQLQSQTCLLSVQLPTGQKLSWQAQAQLALFLATQVEGSTKTV